jgi:molecular chaperone DnaK
MISKKIVGIDLGTTNSVISILEGANPIIINNAEGYRTTPSVVAYTSDGKILVGQLAKRQIILNASNTFYSIKRFIGCKYDEIKNEINNVSYPIIKDKNENIKFFSSNFKKEITAEEISSLILKKLINDANKYLNEEIVNAVITVPAYFNDSQRLATKDAGYIAGLDVKRIINEPTAAALAYGFSKKNNEIILIFDLGGGTFDVSILEIGNGMIEVLSTAGDTHLGGDDIDQIIVKYLINDFEKKEGINLYNDKQALQRIIEASEKAKIELSSLDSTTIDIPYITIKNQIPKHLNLILTRSKFEELIYPLIKKCEIPVLQAIKDAKLEIKDINEVILVGGSIRIPLVKQLLFNLLKKSLNEKVNPDEVVAMGAAVEASIIAGEITDIVLLDVTPLSLGVETEDGLMIPIIKRNTHIPVKSSEKFSTSEDFQKIVTINILQGERPLAKYNKSLGNFILENIPSAPKGVPVIDVTFNLDSDGILSVTAYEQKSGINQTIKIENCSILNKHEIQEIIKNAEENLILDIINVKLNNLFILFDKFFIINSKLIKNHLFKKNNIFFYYLLINKKLKKLYINYKFKMLLNYILKIIKICNLFLKKLLINKL